MVSHSFTCQSPTHEPYSRSVQYGVLFDQVPCVCVCVRVQTIYRTRADNTGYKEKAKVDAASIMCQLDANNDKKLSIDEFVKAATSCSLVMQILAGVQS